MSKAYETILEFVDSYRGEDWLERYRKVGHRWHQKEVLNKGIDFIVGRLPEEE